MNTYKKILLFLRKEMVFTIATIASILTMFAVPITKDYWSYIDFKVLIILFCLMLVVAGFMKIGLFHYIANMLLRKTDNIKTISAILTGLSFFSAMLITNDVALITFIPLTIAILHKVSQKRLVYIIVLETIAANLGSMLTPIGNPQNLYLYSFFQLNIVTFFKILFPIALVSSGIIIVFLILNKKGKLETIQIKEQEKLNKNQVFFYFCLFVLCILSVLHILDYRICFIIVVLAAFLNDKKIFFAIDYALIATFLAFFIVVGNLGKIEPIRVWIAQIIEGRVYLIGILLSQFISNVPAAIMLSGFTNNIRELLIGVNVGGLGTLVASLASLISYKIYMKSENAKAGIFFKIFTVMNLSALIVLTVFVQVIL